MIHINTEQGLKPSGQSPQAEAATPAQSRMDKTPQKFIPLVWRMTPASRRSRKATAPNGIYFVQSVDDGFVLTFQGFFLAKASTMRGAQDYALIHVNKNEAA